MEGPSKADIRIQPRNSPFYAELRVLIQPSQNHPPLAPAVTQNNQAHVLLFSFFHIYINIIPITSHLFIRKISVLALYMYLVTKAFLVFPHKHSYYYYYHYHHHHHPIYTHISQVVSFLQVSLPRPHFMKANLTNFFTLIRLKINSILFVNLMFIGPCIILIVK